MSAIAAPAPAGAPAPSPTKTGMSQGKKIALAVGGLWLAGLVFFIAVWGFKPQKAPDVASGVFQPTDEFKLDTWFKLGPVDFNKGVLYVLLAGIITVGLLFYVARRLQQRPGRLQAAVEMFYGVTSSMAAESLHEERLRQKYFPLIATLF
ncbi:MAG: F0F1 ATP synthase subunit A, partial [Conexibacteraceae bacterium]|nr:F0F1 ATP synthase subunit A [Conexibacteraceae bacterium]